MTKQKVLDRLMMQCSRREYCTSDVRAKALRALDGDQQAAREIVDTLVEHKYVDDFRYCCAYARDKSLISGWGEVKIVAALRAKGVARDVIAAALEEVDDSKADERAMKVVMTKYRALRNDPQWRVKLLRFTLGRGYSYEDALRYISSVSSSTSSSSTGAD